MSVLIEEAKQVARGWRSGSFAAEDVVLDIGCDFTTDLTDLDAGQLCKLMGNNFKAYNATSHYAAEVADRLGEVVMALKVWCKANATRKSGGSNMLELFNERVKEVVGFGPTKAQFFLNFHILCAVYPAFKMVSPRRDVIVNASCIKLKLKSEVDPLKELLRTPAPAVTFKATEEVVLQQRDPEDFGFLACLDHEGAENLNADTWDGCHDGTDFQHLLNQDIEHKTFEPAESTGAKETFVLDEEGDSQAADYDEYAEGSQAEYLATQTQSRHTSGASKDDDSVLDSPSAQPAKFKAAAVAVMTASKMLAGAKERSSSSDGLASAMASTSVGDEIMIKCKVIAGNWQDNYEVSTSVGIKFTDLFDKLDITHEDVRKLTHADFTCLEDQKILEPRNNPDRPITVKKDRHGTDRTIYKHQMRGVVSNMADLENQMTFCIKKAPLAELIRNEREAAPPSFDTAVKGDGPADAAAPKRTTSA